MSRVNCAQILALGVGGNCDFGVTDAAVVIGEQGGGLRGDHGGFEVGSSKTANGLERAPHGLDKNLGFARAVTDGNSYAEKAIDLPKLRQDIFRKVLQVLGQLRFGGAG